MPLLSCPKPETILELVSIPKELPMTRRLKFRVHSASCPDCRNAIQQVHDKLDRYFKPEPDITSSLLKVYSNLQNDETLMIKGWKLGEIPRAKKTDHGFLVSGWFMRGTATLGLATLLVVFLIADNNPQSPMVSVPDTAAEKIPFARILHENENEVEVRYIEPKLLQSVEFETNATNSK